MNHLHQPAQFQLLTVRHLSAGTLSSGSSKFEQLIYSRHIHEGDQGVIYHLHQSFSSERIRIPTGGGGCWFALQLSLIAHRVCAS